MHMWGDNWFEQYGKDLYQAEDYIGDFTYRWARCHLSSKEKYGTIRYEHVFPPCSWGSIRRIPKVYSYWIRSWPYNQWVLFGWWVCGIAVRLAVKRWPHLEAELCSDFPPHTKFGRQCHNKYWTRVE